MTRDELAEIINTKLDPEFRAKSGAVLACGPATIAPGKIYVMGINPGGDPKVITASISENFVPADGASAYTDECWNKQCGDDPACEHMANGLVRPDALVRHQRNMIALAQMLGHETPATLPSANAIFGRSTRLATLEEQTGVDAWRWWQGCWPVHQALLKIVRPAAIITLGYGMNTSAFGFLAALAKPAAIERLGDQNRRGGKTFNCRLDLGGSTLETCVIGVPHPSYYAPGPLLADKLRMRAETGALDG